jgi:hypothetical protein
MPYTTKEDSAGSGTLSSSDGRSASLHYRLLLRARVEDKPGFGRFEHMPELILTFPDGTGGIQGSAIFTTSDGRKVTCETHGTQIIITGSLR